MREGNWKLHLNRKKDGGIALYDLSTDPSDSQNLADKHPDVAADLKTKLEGWASELPKQYEKTDDSKDNRRKQNKGPQ